MTMERTCSSRDLATGGCSVYSFIQQIVRSLLCARYCSRIYSREQNDKIPCPRGACILAGGGREININHHMLGINISS